MLVNAFLKGSLVGQPESYLFGLFLEVGVLEGEPIDFFAKIMVLNINKTTI